MTRRLALGLVGTALALAACQVIAGIEEVEKIPQSSSGSSGSTTSSGSSTGGPPEVCQRVQPPPSGSDDGGEELEPFFVAVKTLSMSKPAENGIVGIDLDDVCTCDKRPGVTFDGGSSCTPRKENVCDLDGGIDNQGAALFAGIEAQLSAFAPGYSIDNDANEDIADGARTVVFYIRKWNGKPNDSSVSVGVFVSQGAVSGELQWKGADQWSHPTEVAPGGSFDPPGSVNGYVVNNRLVIKGANNVTILFGRAGLKFNEALIYGDLTLEKIDGRDVPKFVGIIGGRVPETELVAAAGQLNVGGGGSGRACENPIFAAIVKPQLCDAVDINGASGEKFTGRPCDAVSAAISFTAFGVDVPLEQVKNADNTGDNPCAPNRVGNGYKCN